MATGRTKILMQMNEMFANLDGEALKNSPNIQSIIFLRNELVTRKGFTYEQANQLVCSVDIKLPMDAFDDGEDKALIFSILDKMADMFGDFWEIMEPVLSSFDLFVKMIDGANLTIDS